MDLLNEQVTCFEGIKALCTNYNKDSVTRKTKDYLEQRLTSLEQQCGDFRERHENLIEDIQNKATVPYFTENIYEKTKRMYETTKRSMMELLASQRQQQQQTFDYDLTGMLEERTDDKVKQLMNQQECYFKALDRAMSKINIEFLNEKWEIEDHLSIMKTKWDSIDKQHWELEGVLKGSKLKEEYYKKFEEVERKYDNLRKMLNCKIWSNLHYQQSTPKIEIPEFYGNYVQWISFKDLFLETIHNNPTISKTQKMQHLKTKLKGEAERLVQHLSVSADNYDSCWEILSHRYDNRRLQFTSFMNTMQQLPTIQYPNASNLKRMHDVITETTNGLANMNVDVTNWGPMIVYHMSQKLDSVTFNEYTKDMQINRELPNLQEFLSFLESKFIAFETSINCYKEQPTQKQFLNKNFNKSTNKNNNYHNYNKNVNDKQNYVKKSTYYENNKDYSKTYHTSSFGKCPLCSDNHVLMQCDKFIDMDIAQRNTTVAKLKLCRNCLYSHGNSNCVSTKLCKECNAKHHTLLHYNNEVKSLPTKTENNYQPRPSTSHQGSHHLTTNEKEILLTTVQVKVKAKDGTYVTLRALLDQGSQANLITENATQLLRLPRTKLNATVSGVGSVTGNCKGLLHLCCKSIHSDYSFNTQALVLSKLTNNLPNSTFEKAYWPHLQNLKLADPNYNVSSSIDLLLGADIYSQIILDGVLRGDHDSPIAQQTQLGWILCGKHKTFNCHVTSYDLTDLSKYWEHEDITQITEDISKDDQCEIYYKETTRRCPDGKYIVKMPMIPNYEEKLGTSKPTAVAQFLQLEKRLAKNIKLSTMYKNFIGEYYELQHMKPASQINSASDGDGCYLPHHGVLRESSTTTKLRVVVNASQINAGSGRSLNSLMEKGPNLQKDIQALLLKWRTYKYAFTADIEKMYRSVWLAEDQQKLQKIIWRDWPLDALQEYALCTVTYGTKSAPWLAMRTLQQLAIDDGHKYPTAAKTLQNEFYMDDLIGGHSTLQGAKELQRTLVELLRGGGMNLRKWSSNEPKLLEDLTEDQIAKTNFDFKHEDSMKTLGLGWNSYSDTFFFNWNLEDKPKKLTKRTLLSQISQLYDPLGWFSPVTITAKLIFQRVWTQKQEWDETLTNDVQNDWLKLKNELPQLKTININRWIGSTDSSIDLFGFCDASEKSYACVIYTRTRNEAGQPVINLLAAKTRVAPLSQKLSLPRLELCGALLLSQLMAKVKDALKEHNITCWAWSDSKVVLAWLQGEASKWEKYVENRVLKIKRIIPPENWFYTESKTNPADCATRGLYPNKLLKFNLWWEGPALLKTFTRNQDEKTLSCLFTTKIDEKQFVTTLMKTENNIIYDLLNKISSLNRVIRVIAWIMRFYKNVRSKSITMVKPDTSTDDTMYITTSELQTSTKMIIKYVQQSEFRDEYNLLTKKQTITNRSSIYKLNPYIDEDGILRVGGRLNKSTLPMGMRNPYIISRNGRLTQLLIDQAHITTLHGGARLTLAYIRQRYWIVGGNRAVKTQLRRCVRCHRFKTNDNYQLMADLPPQRVTPSRPFTHTGVDFTGHVEVKLNKGRGVRTSKGYIAIFICMATKAVHIELVSDLSTQMFIAAFQRMCARRGTPKHVYSDCGTNFIGSSNMLRNEFEMFKMELSSEFFDEISKMELEWHFNAPAWPSAGGLWESSVRSMKHFLKRVLGDQKLTYEEFSTLLTKIEACMNSRPLCPLTEDPEEFYNYLTPGHFLTGSPTLTLPLSNYEDDRHLDLRQRWQLTEHMFHQFWKNWSNDYLTQLQARSKWQKPTRNVQKGDLVLVKEDNIPPGKWAMGRIIEVHPGSDGRVRVTTVKTKTGIIKRPIVKLAPLPITTADDASDTGLATSSARGS